MVAEREEHSMNRTQRRIYEHIKAQGERGDYLNRISKGLSIPYSTTRAAIYELIAEGHLEETKPIIHGAKTYRMWKAAT